MNIRSPLPLLLLFGVSSPFLSAQDAPATPPPPTTAPAAQASAPADDKPTDLELRMKRIGKAFRALRKQVADPTQNASSLMLVATMQDAAKEALGFTPAKAQDLPEDQRSQFIQDFQAGIKQMQDLLGKLQGALSAGKNDDAVKIVADLASLEKKDHKEFRRLEKE